MAVTVVSETNVGMQDANLKHIYFFIGNTASEQQSNAHSNDESIAQPSNASSQDRSNVSDPGYAQPVSDNSVTTPSTSSSLQHVYFFLGETACIKNDNSQSDDNSTNETSNGSSRLRSRASSPGSAKAESITTVNTGSSSDLNPLAPTFTPRTEGPGTKTVPPAPSASQMFELRKTAGKGFGLFATSYIKRGTPIICEEPLLKIPSHQVHLAWGPYCRLNNIQKAAYDSLYGFQPEQLNLELASRVHLIDPYDTSLDEEDIRELVADQVRVMGIFSVNNIIMQTGGLAVYATASRLNHSCTPNVHHSYNPTLKTITVHAVRDISPGEELVTTYLGGPGTYQIRSQRIEALRTHYGFTCHCVACEEPSGVSDGRRELMSGLAWGLSQFNAGAHALQPYIPGNAVAALKQAEDLICVMLDEGVITIELTKAYRMASSQALQLKDYDKAVEYAQNEATIERNCIGTQINDLRKLGVAAELWFDEVIRVIGTEKGDSLANQYRSLAKTEKKKHRKKSWIKKKRSYGLHDCSSGKGIVDGGKIIA